MNVATFITFFFYFDHNSILYIIDIIVVLLAIVAFILAYRGVSNLNKSDSLRKCSLIKNIYWNYHSGPSLYHYQSHN